MCKEYLHYETCVKGDECEFSHNIKDINVCLHFLKNACDKGDSCDLKHDLTSHKIPICTYIQQK